MSEDCQNQDDQDFQDKQDNDLRNLLFVFVSNLDRLLIAFVSM